MKPLNNDINIPFGLCEITYDGSKLPMMADEGIFSAIPIYQKLFGGALNSEVNYLLQSYQVSFTVTINEESYNSLKLHMPSLESHEHGLYDNPSNVNTKGKKLIIHPYGADSREFDICIWNAYISPDTEFNRTFKKESDGFEVTFVGKPVKQHTDKNLENSYFFIGDWSKVGEAYA